MKFGSAIALLIATLPLTAVAQHGSAHGGSFGGRGSGGHVGFSGHPGFSARPGFAAHPGFSAPRSFSPSAPYRYGNFVRPPIGRFMPPGYSGPRFATGRNNFTAARPPYQSGFAHPSSPWNHNGDRYGDHDHDRDHDRFRGRALSFQNWYLNNYPGWLGYPYAFDLDPGFFDWGDDDSGYDQSNQPSGYYDQGNQASGYYDQGPGYQPEYEANGQTSVENYGQPGEQPPPWPGPGASGMAPENQPGNTGVSAAFTPPLGGGPLTVVFKGGRAPEQMQNYMLTAKTLTDLDADHYEQIPLDQIDVAATAHANRSSGLEFQVPGASPN
jgi:hypothetical protein